MTQVLVRADASASIGSGHVMRCLALALGWRARGAQVRFACREHPGNLCALLESQGFQVLRLPMGQPHGLFNKSDAPIKCLFWVTPTRKLYDLFWAIHGMKEQNPPDVVALSAKHEVVFLPPPEA